MTPQQRTSVWMLVAAGVLAASAAHAQVVLKTGTLAPENSIWTRTLREMGDGWKRRTEGRVLLRLFPGTVGSESRMLRDLRISKTLHAVQFSAIELSRLDDAFSVFGQPMFFESYEELDAVMAALGPILEQRLERHGLKVLSWGYGGWVHVFSTEPVRTLDDLKRLKLFTSAGDNRMAALYREHGFQPVPVDATQMLASLSTGMIQAVPMTPLSAQLFMWYQHAPYMMDAGIAPLIGATVISRDAWERIGAADRNAVLDEARKAGARLRRDVPRLDREAVEQMKARKLTVVASDLAVWRRVAEQFGPSVRERLVPADVYDLAVRARDAHRQRRATK
jgi:TRAP-type C4-dicarboxylate transport system substrate-binding protein